MSSTFGKSIKISIWGQSHSESIGVVIDGIPAGKKIDMEKLEQFMQRRAPGRDKYSTPRKEADKVEFQSGIIDGVTCGAPICALIRNTNTKSSDYDKIRDIPRPAHADYPAFVRHNGANDVSGGGHFSGRLTAPLCIAGGIAKQFLEEKGITVSAAIKSIGGETDLEKAFAIIDKARENLDSVGGIIECIVSGLPVGVGDPMFDGMENRISQAVFAVPAIKGIEFGNGFECAKLFGSENNDEYYMDGDKIRTKTNNHGGILGGLTSGEDLIFRVAVKPTPSIGKEQKSVSLSRKEDTDLIIVGRHDPCILPRATVCIEAAAAIAVYDAVIDYLKGCNL
ncbi:MAG: chorismate synthase [Clostridia bacterium]|nr:chorismate synthase [Clostridia bacterium]